MANDMYMKWQILIHVRCDMLRKSGFLYMLTDVKGGRKCAKNGRKRSKNVRKCTKQDDELSKTI